MTYPQYSEKYLYPALFEPEDFINYKKIDRNSSPRKMIIAYQSDSEGHFKSRFAGKYISQCLFNYNVLRIGDIGFIKSRSIGAPAAVVLAEDLIATGTREIISIGTAGGLQEEGFFLCTRAIRDEGTSHHYIKPGKYAHPDHDLTLALGESMRNEGVKFHDGTTWTTDAPYRETKKEIKHYRNDGVVSVEMEAAALFALGEARKIKVASAFVISDILGERWDPRFHTNDLKKGLAKLVDSAFTCFFDSDFKI